MSVYLLHAGHEAVMLFFVLSGVALTAMLQRAMSYGAYAVRRIIRLYIPYAAAIVVAAALKNALNGPLPGLGTWLNSFWGSPVDWGNFLQHLLFIGHFEPGRLDFVIWSLVYEMRISLLFPLLLLVMTRLGNRRGLVVFAGVAVVAQGMLFVLPATSSLLLDVANTLGYLLPFAAGIALYKNRDGLRSRWAAHGRLLHWGLLATALILLSYGGRVALRLDPHLGIANDWPVLIGAALLIGILMVSARGARALEVGPLPWLGRVSYSLYLWHPIVLLAVLHLLHPILPLPALILLALALSLLVAHVSYLWLERPSIAWSRKAAAPSPAVGN